MTALLENRGFKITKWICTDPEVLIGVPVDRRAKSVVTFELGDQLPDERALGMKWMVEEDVFAYDVTECEKPLTRRGVLSDVSSTGPTRPSGSNKLLTSLNTPRLVNGFSHSVTSYA